MPEKKLLEKESLEKELLKEELPEKELLEERMALYWLSQIPSLGAVSSQKLGIYFERFSNLFYIEETQLTDCKLLNRTQIAELLAAQKQVEESRNAFGRLAEQGIRFVTVLDEEYPEQLKEIQDYPPGLYVKGRLPEQGRPVLAVVGARGCSAYGEQIAHEFSRALSAEGVQVVSGLALGIDGAAHQGALDAGKPTYGILGCGVNICYPSSHYRLYSRMVDCGGIISEFPLDTKPSSRNFPMRNRIISGMADAILVVEAKERSGSLITAELGLEQGRTVFAVPGRITDRLSAGCNRLIQDGAYMANYPKDILEYLGVKCQKELIIHEINVNGLAKKEKMVYACLDFKPKHLDEIIEKSGLGISECMGILLELELSGYVYRSANHYYGKNVTAQS